MVRYMARELDLILLVVGGDSPSLMGRDWIGKFNFPLGLTWGIFHTSNPSTLQEILGKHQEVFKDKLGLLKDKRVKIQTGESTARSSNHQWFPTP